MTKPSLLNHAVKPCGACPWRKDSSAADIPAFSMQRAEDLAACSPDERNMGPDMGAPLFACHASNEGAEFACAGWLATVGHRHPGVRFAILREALSPDVLEPGPGWPELHATYPEVLQKLKDTVSRKD